MEKDTWRNESNKQLSAAMYSDDKLHRDKRM